MFKQSLNCCEQAGAKQQARPHLLLLPPRSTQFTDSEIATLSELEISGLLRRHKISVSTPQNEAGFIYLLDLFLVLVSELRQITNG